MSRIYDPQKEYLPPDLEIQDKTIYTIVINKETVKVFKNKQDALNYLNYHQRYGIDKAEIKEMELE